MFWRCTSIQSLLFSNSWRDPGNPPIPLYGVAASDGTTRCSVPNGTVIPNRGHYLCVNSVGYSLASYPAGNGTTATGDAKSTEE